MLKPIVLICSFIIVGSMGGVTMSAFAQDQSQIEILRSETKFIFDSFLFLISGMVVMFMAAGFCMLEVGLVRSKNAAIICVKNISLYAVAGIMVWLFGYHLIYSIEPGGYLGSFEGWGKAEDLKSGTYSAHSNWFFQMVFVATCASIVSGTLAERIRFWPFLAFVVVLTGLIYPISASWLWGEGWLAERGFVDFAGSTLVHSVGGWAALTGAILLGPRSGRYLAQASGKTKKRSHKDRGDIIITPMVGSNLPLATLGTFILWLGWFGFNGGSQLALGSIEDVSQISKIFVNTNMAACGGVISVLIATHFLFKKIDLTILLNGVIGGLVSITADPVSPAIWQAIFIGGIGGIIVTVSVPLLDRYKIDDVVGAIPAHLLCGIWGTLIVAWSNSDANIFGQLLGICAIGLFAFVMSFLVWIVLKYSIGIRVSEEDERLGLDQGELGLEAYPEFSRQK